MLAVWLFSAFDCARAGSVIPGSVLVRAYVPARMRMLLRCCLFASRLACACFLGIVCFYLSQLCSALIWCVRQLGLWMIECTLRPAFSLLGSCSPCPQVLPPSIQALFPPRFWLHALPMAGVVLLTVGVTAFIGIQKRSARP